MDSLGLVLNCSVRSVFLYESWWRVDGGEPRWASLQKEQLRASGSVSKEMAWETMQLEREVFMIRGKRGLLCGQRERRHQNAQRGRS